MNVQEIAREIRNSETWDNELLEQLCEAAECWKSMKQQTVKLLKVLYTKQLMF